MNILLPENGFVVYDKEGNVIAETKNDVLYIYRPSMFQRIQYEATYAIYGRTCMYCGKAIATTMDHRIPKESEGPTFTNNLYPTCEKCNSLKANMYEAEFKYYLKLSGKAEKNAFKKKLKAIQEARRYGLIPSLPPEWLEDEIGRPLISMVYTQEPLGARFCTQNESFKTYGKLKTPVVYSSNYVLLDGFYSILIAKLNKMLTMSSDGNQILLPSDGEILQTDSFSGVGSEILQTNTACSYIKLDNVVVIFDECRL